MIKETFFDTLASISVIGGMVRLDFATYDAEANPPEEGQDPAMVVRQRLIIPINGFAQAFGMQEEIIQKLTENNIIQKVDEDKSEAMKPLSPNFKN